MKLFLAVIKGLHMAIFRALFCVTLPKFVLCYLNRSWFSWPTVLKMFKRFGPRIAHNNSKPLVIFFTKFSILDVCQWSEYTSDAISQFWNKKLEGLCQFSWWHFSGHRRVRWKTLNPTLLPVVISFMEAWGEISPCEWDLILPLRIAF